MMKYPAIMNYDEKDLCLEVCKDGSGECWNLGKYEDGKCFRHTKYGRE